MSTTASTSEERPIPPDAELLLSLAAQRLGEAWKALRDTEEAIRAEDELGRIRDPRVRRVVVEVNRASAALQELRLQARSTQEGTPE